MNLIMQVVHVRLKESAKDELSARAFEEVQQWLKSWTPINNIPAVLCDSHDDGVKRCREWMSHELCPKWLKADPSNFQFEVSSQKIVNGRFWLNPGMVTLNWYDI